MARDYKSRATPKKKKKEPVSGWVWFTGGLMLGLFVTVLVWLKFIPQQGGQATAPNPVSVQKKKTVQASTVSKSAKKSAAEEKLTPKPRFDFYTILPEMEVVVPDPEPEIELQKKTTGAAPVVTAGQKAAAVSADYMLQMGSFRKFSDADKLKASLALVGLEAEIQRFTLPGGEVVNRVRSGPYTRGQVNSLRSRLKQNKINSLTIKLKK